jgi:HlyD family secretion protein
MKALVAFVGAHKRVSIAVVAVAVFGGGYVFFNANTNPLDGSITVVERRDISQEVNVTGKVRAANTVDLAFEKGGRVGALYFDVGDRVTVGSVLGSLESSELRAQLLQAEANVKAEEAKLSKLLSGTRPEEIAIAETKVANAKTSLSNATNALENTLQDAFTRSDDAVRNKIDQIFSNANTSSPNVLFSSSNSQLENEVEQGRVAIGFLLSEWSGASASSFTARTSLTRTNLTAVKSFLEKVATLVNGLTVSGGTSQTTLDGWKADISTARTNVNTASSNFITAEGNYEDAQSALTLAEQELLLQEAGVVPEDILAQQAAVEQARANVVNLEAQLYKSSLRAPFSGLVTKREVKVGEIASAGAIAFSLISENSFEIVANIPEADIAKIHLGAPARVSLDAYGDDVPFSAEVVEIDPAETVIDGVSTYQVTFHFSEKDERIRSGMTADLDVVTGERKAVLALPSRLVIQDNGERTLYVLNTDDVPELRAVTVGLRGVDGYIEIISGVSEGDRVVPRP